MSFLYTPFGTPLRRGADQPNRRASVRYQCALATSGRLRLADHTEYRRAWVVDIGQHGVGLLLNKHLQKGQELVVQMKCPDSGKVMEMAAQVAHVTAQADGDWLIGCAFDTPLTEDQVEALL